MARQAQVSFSSNCAPTGTSEVPVAQLHPPVLSQSPPEVSPSPLFPAPLPWAGLCPVPARPAGRVPGKHSPALQELRPAPAACRAAGLLSLIRAGRSVERMGRGREGDLFRCSGREVCPSGRASQGKDGYTCSTARPAASGRSAPLAERPPESSTSPLPRRRLPSAPGWMGIREVASSLRKNRSPLVRGASQPALRARSAPVPPPSLATRPPRALVPGK